MEPLSPETIVQTNILHIPIAELNQVINDNRVELSKPTQMISRYRQEKATNNDYKGRQLLELIQNADDAASPYVEIVLNTEDHTLKVINGGIPFSLEGFRSLMIPNLSPKRKRTYIGNKGLGFRSILNWSKQVTVISAGVKVTFSKEQAAKEFDSLYNKATRDQILEAYEYKKDVIPFPVFAVPMAEVYATATDTTRIEINYLPQEQADIREQIKLLREEVLLFLNHVRKITLDVDGEILSWSSIRQDSSDEISIGSKKWHLFTNQVNGEDPVLPSKYRDPEMTEEEVYSLKIALQDDLADDVCRLFSFFPTKIGLNLPLVVHGTFELDSSRNRIIDSVKNKFLVKQLLSLLFRVADELKAIPGKANWNPLRMLHYGGQTDTVLQEFGFYQAIDEWIKNQEILPCLDDSYRTYNNIRYLPENFTQQADELGLTAHFPELLQVLPADLSSYFSRLFPLYRTGRQYPVATLKLKTEAASRAIYKTLSVQQYARWIFTIGQQFNITAKERLSVLYDNSKELVAGHYTLFTPATKAAPIEVPAHVHIRYIGNDLYGQLLQCYGLNNDAERARKLKDKLDHFVNVQSFEPAPVLTQIITGTNRLVQDTTSNKETNVAYIRAMLRSLYGYYSSSGRANEAQIRTEKIPVINEAGNIVMAGDCFLSADYPSGHLRAELLGDLYTSHQLITTAQQLGMNQANNEIEDFLVDFLGVNRFVSLEKITDQTRVPLAYIDFVFTDRPYPDRYRACRLSYTAIWNLEAIEQQLQNQNISREQLIAWLCLDATLKEKLFNSGDQDTTFHYNLTNQAINAFPQKLFNVPSYIRYQLSTIAGLTNFVMEDAGIPFLNEFAIDFKAGCFVKHNIDVSNIKMILSLLGAKQEFKELSIQRISNLVRSLPEKDLQGRQARKIYQLCTERYKERKETLPKKRDLLLHATKGSQKGYFPAGEIFYANNISLPQKIVQEKAILNYPKRSGEQNVVDFFAVQTFGDISYTATKWLLNTEATTQLGAYLKQISAYILLLRLQRLKTNSDIRDAIKVMKDINIMLCTDLSYDYNGTIQTADPYDFVRSKEDKNTYLLRYTAQGPIDRLKKDSQLSDAIAEIFTIAFDVNNIHAEVRNIFRNDTADTRYQLINEYGAEALKEAELKLELTEKERAAWSVIYQLKAMDTSVPAIMDEQEFRTAIAQQLGIDAAMINRANFDAADTAEQQEALLHLFTQLNIPVAKFNSLSGLDIHFFNYHLAQFSRAAEQLKPRFMAQLWECLRTKTAEQAHFIKRLKEFDTIASALSGENRDQTDLGYTELIGAQIQKKFGFSYRAEDTGKNDYKTQYKQNRRQLDNSDPAINGLPDETLSLLYFDMAEEALIAIRNLLNKEETKPADTTEQEGSDTGEATETKPKKLEELTPSATGNTNPAIPPTRNGGNKGKGRRDDSTQQDRAKIALGKKAEKEVLHALQDKYGSPNVVWLSEYSDHPERSDSWGYDIKFREGEDAIWQYVEVKWFGNGYFYLSGPELRVAQENTDTYYLYLVDDNVIKYLLFDKLLSDSFELSEYNDYFSFYVSEYKFVKK